MSPKRPPRPAKPSETRTNWRFQGRLAVLALMVVLTNTWSRVHLGLDWTSLGAVDIVLATLAVTGYVMTKKEQEGSQNAIKRLLRGFVSTPPIIGLGVVMVLVGVFVSTAIVERGSDEGTIEVRLMARGDGVSVAAKHIPEGSGALARFVRLTTPLGTPLRVDADGRLAHDVTLYPIVPTRISLDRDLAAEPTVILRVPPEQRANLDVGILKVHIDGVGSYQASTSTDSASVALGGGRAATERLVEEWRSEVRSRDLEEAPVDERSEIEEQIVRLWKNATAVEGVPELRPGMRLSAEFIVNAAVRARAQFELTSGAMQDRRLDP